MRWRRSQTNRNTSSSPPDENRKSYFTIFATASLLLLPTASLLASFYPHPLKNVYFNTERERETETEQVAIAAKQNTTNDESKNHCLSLDLDNDMEHLLQKFKQVFVLMPTKAAGTTYLDFMIKCSGYIHYNPFNRPTEQLEPILTSQLQMPSVIISHIGEENFPAMKFDQLSKIANRRWDGCSPESFQRELDT